MRVELREIVEADLDTLCSFQDDPEIVASGFVPHRPPGVFHEHMRKTKLNAGSLGRSIWVDGVLAGSIMKFFRGGVHEIGYLIGREFWGKGIASIAVEQMLELSKDRPMYGVCLAENVASQRVLQKAGFRLDHKVVEADGVLVFHYVLI